MPYLRLLMSAGLLAVLTVACEQPRKDQFFSDTAPQVDAPVRTSDGQSAGTVERVRFETPAQAVIDAYVIEYGGTLDVGGREVLVPASRASWSGGELSPLLEIDYTYEELEALPEYDPARALEGPEALPASAQDEPGPAAELTAPGEPAPGTSAAAEEGIVWVTTEFGPPDFDRNEWLDQEVFTTNGGELGIIVEVRPEEGEPQTLVVQTFPEYHAIGRTVEIDVRQINATAENERAVRANFNLIERDPSDIPPPQ